VIVRDGTWEAVICMAVGALVIGTFSGTM